MRPKKQILLVGEREDRTSVLKFMLTTNGFAVTVAGSAALGVEMFRDRIYDLLLCEWPLAGIAGLLDEARAIDSSVPSMVLAPTLRGAGADFFADSILRRPFCSAELLERIKVITIRKRGPKKPVMRELPRSLFMDIKEFVS
jgi:DNA-binding response OmpR family regulator